MSSTSPFPDHAATVEPPSALSAASASTAPSAPTAPTAPTAPRQVVALDGPSGTGKSTVAQGLARRLGYRYLDTGAMYRAVTVAVLDAAIDIDDSTGVAEVVRLSEVTVGTEVDDRQTYLNGRSVTARIRSQEVTAAVSKVSAVPAVRTQLVSAQRALIASGDIVVEGRDIGSVVWPAAAPKIYLTADEQVRAQRRSRQLQVTRPEDAQGSGELGSGDDVGSNSAATPARPTGIETPVGSPSVDDIRRDLRRRDRFDSARATSPLTRTVDAVEVDTTKLSIDEVIDVLVDLCQTENRALVPPPGQ